MIPLELPKLRLVSAYPDAGQGKEPWGLGPGGF